MKVVLEEKYQGNLNEKTRHLINKFHFKVVFKEGGGYHHQSSIFRMQTI